MARLLDMPPELAAHIVDYLCDDEGISGLSSLALVWRYSWHQIRKRRFESVDITTRDFLDWLWQLLQTEPERGSLVKHINIQNVLGPQSGRWSHGRSPLLNVTEILERAPNITRLSLQGFSENIWQHIHEPLWRVLPNMPCLKTLELDAYQTSSVHHLFDLLQRFPALEALRLSRICIMEIEQFGNPGMIVHNSQNPFTQLFFPYLAKLVLDFYSRSDAELMQVFVDHPDIAPCITTFELAQDAKTPSPHVTRPISFATSPHICGALKRVLEVSSWHLKVLDLRAFNGYSRHLQVDRSHALVIPASMELLLFQLPIYRPQRRPRSVRLCEFWIDTLIASSCIAAVEVYIHCASDTRLDAEPVGVYADVLAQMDKVLAARAHTLVWEDTVHVPVPPRTAKLRTEAACAEDWPTMMWLYGMFPFVHKKFFQGDATPLKKGERQIKGKNSKLHSLEFFDDYL
ncbi:hypothetical protein CYLTODRAFT_413491 [Cylindrobasidium torrendii FP15055 ss-10]|uniref:F-box domain-containing protein n=1 Tax=Cylindrobasidium torrendii FP15055 ss-10 TaxID=1314674 RepID=A0A0D7B3X5_9AGAR|nr:hypothetical protein CYLTODRAFT_413491 [Cylindrobasidium torrendii FP15055 ss-10]